MSVAQLCPACNQNQPETGKKSVGTGQTANRNRNRNPEPYASVHDELAEELADSPGFSESRIPKGAEALPGHRDTENEGKWLADLQTAGRELADNSVSARKGKWQDRVPLSPLLCSK